MYTDTEEELQDVSQVKTSAYIKTTLSTCVDKNTPTSYAHLRRPQPQWETEITRSLASRSGSRLPRHLIFYQSRKSPRQKAKQHIKVTLSLVARRESLLP